MRERFIRRKLTGIVNRRAVGSGGAERRRRSTAQHASQADLETQLNKTRSPNETKHTYSKIAVFFYRMNEKWTEELNFAI